jgi:hypothetical protein
VRRGLACVLLGRVKPSARTGGRAVQVPSPGRLEQGEAPTQPNVQGGSSLRSTAGCTKRPPPPGGRRPGVPMRSRTPTHHTKGVSVHRCGDLGADLEELGREVRHSAAAAAVDHLQASKAAGQGGLRGQRGVCCGELAWVPERARAGGKGGLLERARGWQGQSGPARHERASAQPAISSSTSQTAAAVPKQRCQRVVLSNARQGPQHPTRAGPAQPTTWTQRSARQRSAAQGPRT